MIAKKRALVTGGSGAIGSVICQRLAADGYAVIVHAHRHLESAEQVAEKIRADGGTASVTAFDVVDGTASAEALRTILEAGPIRLRPILMTTIAMIAGMIPVALAKGDGAETRVPMAIAIIGGLVSSTVLTLVVVPVFYSLLERLKRRPRLEIVEPVAEARPTGT